MADEVMSEEEALTVDMDLSTALTKAIRDQSKEHQFCDVTIEVEGKTFRSHRFILSATSGFFRALFASGMIESESQHICLQGVSAEMFGLILQSLMECKNVITEDNYAELWQAVDMLEMLSLKSKVEEFVTSHINVENCFTIQQLSVKLNSPIVLARTWKFVLKNFDQVCADSKNADFLALSLSLEDLEYVVGNDLLCTSSENNVVNVIMAWVNPLKYLMDKLHKGDRSVLTLQEIVHEFPDVMTTDETPSPQTNNHPTFIYRCYPHAQHLPRLLSKCRLLLTSNDFLVSLLHNDVMMRYSPESRDVLERCLRLKLLTNLTYNMSTIWSIHRLASRTQSVFLYFREGSNLRAALLEDSAKVTFHQSCSYITKFEKPVTSAVVLNDQILALTADGALYSKPLHDTSAFEMLTKKTKQARGLVVVDNKLYQVGKSITPAVLRVHYLVVHSLSLSLANNLMMLDNLRLVGQGSNIVIFGNQKDVPDTTVIQIYDTHTQTARRLEDVPGTASGLVCFQTYEQTFFLFSDGHLWKLSTGENSQILKPECVMRLWGLEHQIYGALIVNEKLVVCCEGELEQTVTDELDVAVEGVFKSVVRKQLIRGNKFAHFLNANLPSELCKTLKKF